LKIETLNSDFQHMAFVCAPYTPCALDEVARPLGLRNIQRPADVVRPSARLDAVWPRASLIDRWRQLGYFGHMGKASISETKNRLSALIDRVRKGETILITDRRRPVAQLGPVLELSGVSTNERLISLERAGVVRRARKRLPAALSRRQGPAPKKGASALAALIAERREGR
jgi:prevent-host-death family protein